MMQTTLFSLEQDIPVFAEPDILVIGGGVAGIAAAYCAARRGASVLLAERSYSLGGTATSGLVGPFMTSGDPEGKRQLICGFFRELVDRLIAAGGAMDPMKIANGDAHSSWHPHGHHNITPFNAEVLKFEAETMCLEQNVQLLYSVQAVGVRKTSDGRKIDGVVFAAKEGAIYIRAKQVIDCTGDGDIAAMAGCPMVKGDEADGEMQAAGLFFALDGIDETVFRERALKLGWESMRYENEIRAAVENGEYPVPRRRLGLYKAEDGTWRANITRIPDVDGTKSEDLTKIMIEGRKQIRAILKFLRKYVKGCEQVHLIKSAEFPGIRETRRIKGDFVMEGKSIHNAEIFPDAILLLSNSVDFHKGLVGDYRPCQTVYSLPYRLLLPAKMDNLLTAGRCVSCDREVLAAIRVMPPCFGMGQAAGNAAVLALETGCTPAAIDITELQNRLRKENVVLDLPQN